MQQLFNCCSYFPPVLVREREIFVHRLLSMFHERPFVMSRFGPQGAVGCVRAINLEYIEVVFRCISCHVTTYASSILITRIAITTALTTFHFVISFGISLKNAFSRFIRLIDFSYTMHVLHFLSINQLFLLFRFRNLF